jgi:spore germination protein KC
MKVVGVNRVLSIIVLGCYFISSLTGCWNRREIETLGFILAAGLDQAVLKDQVQLTVQIAKPAAIIETKNPANERSFWVVGSSGRTVLEATQKLVSQSPRTPFWNHNRFIIFGEKLARQGISEYLDFLEREGAIRHRSYIILVKAGQAKDLLQAEFELEKLPMKGLQGILLATHKGLSNIVLITLNDFTQMMATEGMEPVATAAELTSRPPKLGIQGRLKREEIAVSARLSGAAAFKDDKLVGWLNDSETRGLQWISGKISSSVIVIKHPRKESKLIGLKILRASKQITPEILNGRPVIKVKIIAEADVGDVEEFANFLTEPKLWTSLERRMATVIQNEARAALKVAQTQFHSDIFGFGAAIYRNFPRDWRRFEHNWAQEFSRLDVSIKVKAKIRRTGQIFRNRKIIKGE